ncbi:hypothetical protein LCGC14_1416870 [marine sediment metagenome]|uniref:DUF4326 domain-containing protein n=1 Tax=marine sediment metagenome TaxID=412755 RepID=A0A0F9KDT6_9ZZZZ
MRTRVTNIRYTFIDTRLIGTIRIDRTTIFGNPFKIKKGCTRKQSIEKFKSYFYNRIKTDKVFRQRIKALGGHVLGCWCKPLLCHGDIIVEYLDSENEKKKTYNRIG